MAYNTKKYLDEEGLKQVVRLLDEYPDNQILGTVIDEIQSELDKKADVVSIPEVPVQDVQVAGTSILSNGIANIPQANSIIKGVASFDPKNGVGIDTASGAAYLNGANEAEIKAAQAIKAINAAGAHIATFYGLAKAAGDTTQSQSSNTVGTYTPEAKGAIQKMLGVSDLIATEENNLVASKVYAVGDVFTANGKLYKATAAIATDGAIITDGANANCEETNVGEEFVKKTDYATTNAAGVVKVQYGGLRMTNDGRITTAPASTDEIKTGAAIYVPISPSHVHESAFYGLAKAAGADEKDSTLPVGQYTDNAKTAIRSMIGAVGDVQVNETSVVSNGVANIPYATNSRLGLVQGSGSNGVKIGTNGILSIDGATSAIVKTGTDSGHPITANHGYEIAFYGLAKAAGDTTQAASSNAVGTYTSEAKTAIQEMLGVESGVSYLETHSETDPVIVGAANTRYMCGEVTTLNITPPSSGAIDIIFTSGTTPTILTVPSTVKFPDWFDATTLETNMTYEINILDGTYGAVMSWSV